jgi:hypothetical protein
MYEVQMQQWCNNSTSKGIIMQKIYFTNYVKVFLFINYLTKH